MRWSNIQATTFSAYLVQIAIVTTPAVPAGVVVLKATGTPEITNEEAVVGNGK
jgi:hypothetical protein